MPKSKSSPQKQHIAQVVLALEEPLEDNIYTQVLGTLQAIAPCTPLDSTHLILTSQRTDLHIAAAQQLLAGQILATPAPPGLAQAAATDTHGKSSRGTAQPASLMSALHDIGCDPELIALHHGPTAKAILWSVMHPWSMWELPVDDIRAYFGEAIALYFAWAHHMCLALIPLAIFGVAIAMNRVPGGTVDTAAYLPLYSAAACLWGIIFVRTWRRKAAALSAKWGTLPQLRRAGSSQATLDAAALAADPRTRVRAEYYGIQRTNPITGKQELHYPRWRRALKIAVSALVTLVMLCVVLGVLVCLMNLEGYMLEPDAPLHVPVLNAMAGPDGWFDMDSDSWIWPNIPVILHAGLLLAINQGVYSRIAEKLTDWENWRTHAEYERALVLKRFIFEALDCYAPLAYLAWGEQNMLMLRSELLSLFSTDSVRRVLTEVALPLVTLVVHLGRVPGWPRKARAGSDLWEPAAQLRREEAEGFDDYLELVIMLGYTLLFASALPWAAAASALALTAEIRSDMAKLVLAVRKPLPLPAHDLGVWEPLTLITACAAVLTNLSLFGLVSDQLVAWTPDWFEYEGTVTHRGMTSPLYKWKEGEGRDAVALLWGLEHVLVSVLLVLWHALPAFPRDVRAQIAAEEHRIEQAALASLSVGKHVKRE